MIWSWLRTKAVTCVTAGLVGASASGAPPDDSAFVADTRAFLSKLEKLGFAGVVVVAQEGGPIRGTSRCNYPEANAIVPRRVDAASGTPAFKSIAARRLTRRERQLTDRPAE